MKDFERPHLDQLLKDEFTVFDSVIDVGCAGMLYLFDFDFSPFQKLVGIDKNFPIYKVKRDIDAIIRYQEYLKDKPEKMAKFDSPTVDNSSFQAFVQQRFTLSHSRIESFNFQKNTYSFLICKQVLHFFNGKDKLKWISVFYDAIQPGGLMYLNLNHNTNTNNADPSKVRRIDKEIFQGIKNPFDIRYLVEPSDFIAQLTSYKILENYTVVDEDSLTLVIRK